MNSHADKIDLDAISLQVSLDLPKINFTAGLDLSDFINREIKIEAQKYNLNLDHLSFLESRSLQVSLEQINQEDKIEQERFIASLNYYNDPLIKLFFSHNDDEIIVPPTSPKPIRKTPAISKSDTKPRSMGFTLENDPLVQNIWSHIITFLDCTSIAFFKQTGKLIHLAPIFLQQQSAIDVKKSAYEYQLFLRSLPKPKVTYYSHATLFADERNRAREAERIQRLPDLHNDSNDGQGFVMQGRKV